MTVRVDSVSILRDLAFQIKVPNVDFVLIVNKFARIFVSPLDIDHSNDNVLGFKIQFGLEQTNVQDTQSFKKGGDSVTALDLL